MFVGAGGTGVMLMYLVLCLLVVGVRGGGRSMFMCIVFVSARGTGVMLMFLVLCSLVLGVRGSC